jgi:hypothetical protein
VRLSYQDVTRKARFGHRDWVVYRDNTGLVTEPATAATVKAAMLATGTQGSWTLVGANDGHGMRMTWRLGMNVYRQFVKGWR